MKNNKKDLLFFGLLLVISFAYGYHDILTMRPQGLHQWRQCDCASQALNYFQGGMHFFEPSLHIIAKHQNGKAVSDFPFIYYLVASLWKLFGVHEFIYRLLNIAIAFSGLFALFRLSVHLIKDFFWAAFIPVIVFCCPFYAYYANNFLSNVPALSFAFIGWYFFEKFSRRRAYGTFILALLFFLLAALLKLSAGLSLIIVGGLFFMETVFKVPLCKNKKLFAPAWQYFLSLAISVTLVFLWLNFVKTYNKNNNQGFFLTTILPVWELDSATIGAIVKNIKDIWLTEYMPKSIYVLCFIQLIFMLVFRKYLPRIAGLVLALCLGGFISFITLFFAVLGNHDYYLIDMLVLLVAINVSFFTAVKACFPAVLKNDKIKIVTLLFLVFIVHYSSKKVNINYDGDVWMNEHHKQYTVAFEDIEKINRSLGIKPSDKVISIPDHSISITLYLMNQHGWTDYGNDFARADEFKKCIGQGARYLFVNDSTLLLKDELKPFIKNKMAQYKNVAIFKLSNY